MKKAYKLFKEKKIEDNYNNFYKFVNKDHFISYSNGYKRLTIDKPSDYDKAKKINA